MVGNNNKTLPTVYNDNSALQAGLISADDSNITAVEGYFLFQNNHATLVRFSFVIIFYLLNKTLF